MNTSYTHMAVLGLKNKINQNISENTIEMTDSKPSIFDPVFLDALVTDVDMNCLTRPVLIII